MDRNTKKQNKGQFALAGLGLVYLIMAFCNKNQLCEQYIPNITLAAAVVSIGKLAIKVLIWRQYFTSDRNKREKFARFINWIDGLIILIVMLVVSTGSLLLPEEMLQESVNFLTIFAFSCFYFELLFDELIDEKEEQKETNSW